MQLESYRGAVDTLWVSNLTSHGSLGIYPHALRSNFTPANGQEDDAEREEQNSRHS